MSCLRGIEIVIIGGDNREVELYRIWNREGMKIKMWGFGLCPQVPQEDRAGLEDLNRASVLIFPLSGIRERGAVLASFAGEPVRVEPLLENVTSRTLVMTGSVASDVLPLFEARKVKLLLTGEDQELAILNSIPTAEGAIQRAMELSGITIHGSKALVLGLGRCGISLARALQGLGAKTTVLVRRREACALAVTLGLSAIFADELERTVGEMDFIFNTVPAPAQLLTASLLEKVNKEAIILDLASPPGGTDFQAAASLKLTAMMLPGLPGKVAPKSSGKILAGVYKKIIAQNL